MENEKARRKYPARSKPYDLLVHLLTLGLRTFVVAWNLLLQVPSQRGIHSYVLLPAGQQRVHAQAQSEVVSLGVKA